MSVASAAQGLRYGLLALTNRRLLFLYFDDVCVDVPRNIGRAVKTRRLGSAALAVESHVFTNIDDDRIEELISLLARQPPKT